MAHGILVSVSALHARTACFAARRPLSGYRVADSRTLLKAEKIPDARKCETQFRIGPRPDVSSDDVGCRKRGPRGIGNPRDVLRFGSAAEQDSKAHPVRHSA